MAFRFHFSCRACLCIAALCVLLQAVELTRTGAATRSYCECRRCGAPMCRQVCHLDCLSCCKCCVYFDLRVGRRSAAPKTDGAATVISNRATKVHGPHQRKPTAVTGPAAAERSSRRSRRGLSTSTMLSLLLLSVTRDGPPHLTSCSDAVRDLPITSPPRDSFSVNRGVLP